MVKGLTMRRIDDVIEASKPFSHKSCAKSEWLQTNRDNRRILSMTKQDGGEGPARKPATRLVTGGRNPFAHHGYVNPPVYHASTLLYRTADDYLAHRGRYNYGRLGTPTSEALSGAIAELEGGLCAGVALLPSGLTAASIALMSALKTGDHLLVTDSVYWPTRKICDKVLNAYGISTTYYDPHIGGGIAAMMQPNTRAVYVESPGSLTFEVQDIPAIAAAAHAHGALVLMDNTWASPLYFRALEKGVDLSIQSGTKYIGGHSDVMLGTISANKKAWPALIDRVQTMGLCVGPDDMYFGLRGLRTMGVRLAQHQASGLKVARWLLERPEVARLLHPAHASHPDHSLWKRDYLGACGLFSVVLKPVPAKAVHAFVEALSLFGIGASWGGFESLCIPFDAASMRSATPWAPCGPTLRFHIGLEDVDDLIGDLERGFAVMAQNR
jgi:cysteine-S-conjugate beta-lyase